MNIYTRTLDFISFLEKKKLIVTKECTWTPYYSIFLVDTDGAKPLNYKKQDFIQEKLQFAFPDCVVRYNRHLNEIEIEHPDSKAYFDKHRDILEEIGMKYEGWTAFLTDE